MSSIKTLIVLKHVVTSHPYRHRVQHITTQDFIPTKLSSANQKLTPTMYQLRGFQGKLHKLQKDVLA